MTKELTKNNTFNLVYKREYVDSDNQQYDDYFPIYYTIFRNIPIKFLNKINTDTLKKNAKICVFHGHPNPDYAMQYESGEWVKNYWK